MKKLICITLSGLFILSVVAITGCPKSQTTRPDHNYRGETISSQRFEVVNGQSDDSNGNNSAGGLGMTGAAADVGANAAAGGKNAHGTPR